MFVFVPSVLVWPWCLWCGCCVVGGCSGSCRGSCCVWCVCCVRVRFGVGVSCCVCRPCVRVWVCVRVGVLRVLCVRCSWSRLSLVVPAAPCTPCRPRRCARALQPDPEGLALWGVRLGFAFRVSVSLLFLPRPPAPLSAWPCPGGPCLCFSVPRCVAVGCPSLATPRSAARVFPLNSASVFLFCIDPLGVLGPCRAVPVVH